MSEVQEVKEKELIAFKKRKYVRLLVDRAVKSGLLIKPRKCELCCENKKSIDAHHTDYGDPLKVIWLCRACHGKAHRKGHPLNPENFKQSPLPSSLDHYDQITVSFTVPAQNFIYLKRESEKRKKPISKIIREEVMKNFPVLDYQMQLFGGL